HKCWLHLPDQRNAAVLALNHPLPVGWLGRAATMSLTPGVGPNLRSGFKAELLLQPRQFFWISPDLRFGLHKGSAIKARRDVWRRLFVKPGHRLQTDERVEPPAGAVLRGHIKPGIAEITNGLALRLALAFRTIAQKRADTIEPLIALTRR